MRYSHGTLLAEKIAVLRLMTVDLSLHIFECIYKVIFKCFRGSP